MKDEAGFIFNLGPTTNGDQAPVDQLNSCAALEQESVFSTPRSSIKVFKLYANQGNNGLQQQAENSTRYQIIWIEHGRGRVRIDLDSHTFIGPCLVLIHPRNRYEFTGCLAMSGGVIELSESFLIHSSELGNLMTQFCVFDDVNVRSLLPLSVQENEDFSIMLNELIKVGQTNNPITAEIEGYFLRIMLLKVYQLKHGNERSNPTMSVHRARYHAFKVLLEAEFRVHHNVSFYINALNTTEKTLRNSTNILTGRSPSTLIQARLILEARRLLRQTSKSIKEIAFELGFEDPSYFTRLFSKKLGVSPNVFRREKMQQFDF
jgi:AraC family transcriptional regulator, transcriptional activator of pobA